MTQRIAQHKHKEKELRRLTGWDTQPYLQQASHIRLIGNREGSTRHQPGCAWGERHREPRRDHKTDSYFQKEKKIERKDTGSGSFACWGWHLCFCLQKNMPRIGDP